ncbi:MAG: multidrug transporter subunit MdtC [Ferrovum sp. 37-45-19]|nr:MAG: multidrug transporter subunit MdtC [Ferrovum sp. 21-44-67]OYV93871.1 MAG: multidrug transporter subunit MdtC [Ferrovum sp. 37-45-19]HQT82037.1 efflux RND transporter permease subunit [Ferrovaceae bacterium]HQU07161.1 efflux RND transporter permease subunit [Ferrovaceae bacterium]
MNITKLFILRPVATTLLTAAIALAGIVAFVLLPVAPLPQVDFPAIFVQVALPGANPDTMASTIATPLEKTLSQISGVAEVTSSSTSGSTNISLLFDLDRDINGAARDVMAAINAARTNLPTGLPNNPIYKKFNAADAPILILSMTSETLTAGAVYDAASTIVAQKLSQVDGVGQVTIGGSSLPAVRIELNPPSLNRYGISIESVRSAINANNVFRPKGFFANNRYHWQIRNNDQVMSAAQYRDLIITYKNGNPVRLSDVATVIDDVEDSRHLGIADGHRAIIVIVSRQPNANIIDTVQHIKDAMPQIQASIPPAVNLKIVMDRTPTIKGSLFDVEITLLISTLLVVLVVYVFLREGNATFIPSIVVPVSILGTFGVMFLLGYSLNNLSLMALTISTGFVVDDAIVILENISRYIEQGLKPIDAAIRGAKEVTFTVISISISLVAVFVPLLLMGGLVGRIFREFSVVLSVAILVSLVISLTTTPMLCARILKKPVNTPLKEVSKLKQWLEKIDHLGLYYSRSLSWALKRKRWVLLSLFLVIGLNFYLFTVVPKGFFPQQDTGRIIGRVQADQDISFQAMRDKMIQLINICKADPETQNVIGFTGGEARNAANVFIILKPKSERHLSADEVIARLRKKLVAVSGATLYLQAIQDFRFGGRTGNAQYQYTLEGSTLTELRFWAPKIKNALSKLPTLADVNTDQEDKGIEQWLDIDRDTASKLGVNTFAIDQTLNDLYGQRIISTIYHPLNQYRVVMEAAPEYLNGPSILQETYVTGRNGAIIPLSAFVSFRRTNTPLTVSHQGDLPATTITFNLPKGVSLGQATQAINDTFIKLGVPSTVRGGFQGTAKVFIGSLSNEPILILVALITVYIVLGILYESLVHPFTILSTLPSAGVGALLGLEITGLQFDLIGLIGVILLIGIVKKNAIIMIDFALQAERLGKSAEEAVIEACNMRFRPIIMTTLAAMLGAIPLAIGFGDGGELRRPLGVAIVGGLTVSQILTLYTTPVVYIYLDRLRQYGFFGLLKSKRVAS